MISSMLKCQIFSIIYSSFICAVISRETVFEFHSKLMNSEKGLDNLYPYHNFLEPTIYFFTLKQLFLFVFEPVFTINTRAL